MKHIPYSHQYIDLDDIEEVVKVLKSDWITQGPKVREFEQSLSDYCGARFAVAFSSGTAALHAAYFAAGLGSNDEIVTSPMTFLATSNAALFLGAEPVFVDVQKDTGNIAPDLIEKAITGKTKAIVPIHFAGHPVDLEKIAEIAQRHHLLLIEDACHALGAKYKNTTIGDCRYSDMAVFSFHPVKSITTGEGGAVLTNNEEFRNKLIMLRHHGVTKDRKIFQNKSDAVGDWYHEMQCLGYNYRLTDIHSALGISQLRKLDKFIQKRREIVETYAEAFEDNKFFDAPVEKGYAKSAWHLYPIRLKDKYKRSKADIFAKLRERGLGVQVHYIPVHLQPYYQQLGYKTGACPNAEDFYEREISIPLYPVMSSEDVDYVINNIFELFDLEKFNDVK
ncbi:MAG: UDP-4-amino-4,6-dideoxy-N-acetyl-beta-L-altrosamine transaminase [Desulfobacteraceae bacterium]|nr:UDP-4-amino-4,6-dideoxy-N-acetyl-beta-L-altrosamine transaminase [Desulfobacteraceae bacterium]